MERYVSITLPVLAAMLVFVFCSYPLLFHSKPKVEDVGVNDECQAEERGSVLSIGTEWMPNKTNLEGALINREIATTFANQNYKVYCVVYRASEEERTDALKIGVTLITKDERKTTARNITYQESLMWYTEFYYPNITKLQNVRFIVGQALPVNGTIDEAIYIRDKYFNRATVLPIFFYIPEDEGLRPSELVKQQRQMEDCAKSADLVILLGSKIFDYFQSKLRAYPGINLHFYLPYPRTDKDLHPVEDWESPAFFEILTFHVDMEIKEDKFHSFEMSGEILGDIYRGLSKREKSIRWKLLGVSDEIQDSFHSFLNNITNNKRIKIISYPPSSLNDILHYLKQCHLVLYTGENAFGMPVFLAANAGTPFITSDETGFAAFLMNESSGASCNCIVENDKNNFVEKIRDLFESYPKTKDSARKTKVTLERSAQNGTIAKTKEKFLTFLSTLHNENRNEQCEH